MFQPSTLRPAAWVAVPLVLLSAAPASKVQLSVKRVGDPTAWETPQYHNGIDEASFQPTGRKVEFRCVLETDYETDYWFRAVMTVYPTTTLDQKTGYMTPTERPVVEMGLDPRIIGGRCGGKYEASATFNLPPGIYQGRIHTEIATDGKQDFQRVSGCMLQFTVR